MQLARPNHQYLDRNLDPADGNRIHRGKLPMSTTALTYVAAAVSLAVGFSNPSAAAESIPRFEQFPAKIYKGRTHLPKFQTRDKAFREYRTMIRERLTDGPSFAGEFSIVALGCGTDCVIVFVASNRTGEVFEFPASYAPLRLMYQTDSRFIVVQTGSPFLPSFPCQLDWYVWGGRQAKVIKTETVGSGEVCGNTISENLQIFFGRKIEDRLLVSDEAVKIDQQ
jgi:hypothetical protein